MGGWRVRTVALRRAANPANACGPRRAHKYWAHGTHATTAAAGIAGCPRASPGVDKEHDHGPIAVMSTVDTAEVAAFEARADRWWDEDGPHAALHRLNPARIGYIRDRITDHFGSDRTGVRPPHPLAGLRVLDVGCGGGLISEPMARLGASVTGIDAGEANIAAARAHAAQADVTIDYRATTAEAMAESGSRFDVVLALEIIEHVARPSTFVNALGACTEPGGLTVLSTLNRTARSFALGIVAAEYVLGWVPRGSHRWSKFITPAELARLLHCAGLRPQTAHGLRYDPFTRDWVVCRDLAVNYLITAHKPPHP